MKISAVIIAYNEEENIERCIKSLSSVSDEIVVVDSYSSDKTTEIAKSCNARVILNEFAGYIEQKNFAIAQARYDTILSLDADEELSMQLVSSISKFKRQSDETQAAQINRRSFYLGKWIAYSGWYPDQKIRIFNKNSAEWGGVNPHDKIILNPNVEVKALDGDLLHYPYSELSAHLRQINNFTTMAANQKHKKGEIVIPVWHLFLYPGYIFIKTFFLKLGMLDGYQGFILSYMNAYYRFLKYAKLRELNDSSK